MEARRVARAAPVRQFQLRRPWHPQGFLCGLLAFASPSQTTCRPRQRTRRAPPWTPCGCASGYASAYARQAMRITPARSPTPVGHCRLSRRSCVRGTCAAGAGEEEQQQQQVWARAREGIEEAYAYVTYGIEREGYPIHYSRKEPMARGRVLLP